MALRQAILPVQESEGLELHLPFLFLIISPSPLDSGLWYRQPVSRFAEMEYQDPLKADPSLHFPVHLVWLLICRELRQIQRG